MTGAGTSGWMPTRRSVPDGWRLPAACAGSSWAGGQATLSGRRMGSVALVVHGGNMTDVLAGVDAMPESAWLAFVYALAVTAWAFSLGGE